MLIFSHLLWNPHLKYVRLFPKKEKWHLFLVRSPTYAVLSRNQFCRELRAHGRGGSQKVTNDDEGEGGSRYPPKVMTSFMNSPLVKKFPESNYSFPKMVIYICCQRFMRFRCEICPTRSIKTGARVFLFVPNLGCRGKRCCTSSPQVQAHVCKLILE